MDVYIQAAQTVAIWKESCSVRGDTTTATRRHINGPPCPAGQRSKMNRADADPLAQAIAVLKGDSKVNGVITFEQAQEGAPVTVTGDVSPRLHHSRFPCKTPRLARRLQPCGASIEGILSAVNAEHRSLGEYGSATLANEWNDASKESGAD